MGAWDTKPWDNDSAADWFGDLFGEIQLREKVVKALEMDLDDGHEEIRAAASILIFLGRTYIWPIDHIDDDLSLAIKRMEEIKRHEIYAEVEDFVTEIENEIAVLKERLDKDSKLPGTEKFKNWCLALMK